MPFSRESALNGTSLALTILTGLGSLVFIGAGMLASRAPYLEYILDVTKSIPTSIDMLLSTSLYTIPADFNRGMIESSDLGWWLIGAGNVLLVSTFPSFLAVSTGVRRRGAKKGNNFSPVVDADAETEAPKPFVNPARKRRFLEFALLFIAVDLFVAGGAASYALVRVNFNRQQLSGLVARQMDVVPQLELLMMQIDNKCCGFQQGVIADGTVALGDVLSIMQETFAGNANITDQMAVTIEDRFLGTSVNPCETEAKVKSMPACYEMVKSSVDMQFMAFIGILAGMSLILIANLAINIVLYRQARALPTEPAGPNGTAMAKLEEDFESMKEPADYPPPASKKVIRTTTASQPGAAAPPVYEEKQ